MTRPTREQVLELIDSVAKEWDGCEYEDAMIPDIGNAIRRSAYPRVVALFTELANASGVPTPFNDQGETR